MKGKHPDSLIGVAANAAEMHYALHTRLCDGLLIVMTNLCDSSHNIKVRIKEGAMAEGLHGVDYIRTGECFCEKSRVLHGANGSFGAKGFDLLFPVGRT